MFVSIDLLGPKEMILTFEKQCQKIFGPSIIVLRHLSCWIIEEKWAKLFFSSVSLQFFQKSCYQQPLRS